LKQRKPAAALRAHHPDSTAEILPTHTPALFAAAVARAVELLRAGEVVALPTETVYGLAANALDARAVERIFAAKGRPAGNPIIVHVASRAMAQRCAREWPASAERLARAFWPGPLTLVLGRADEIPAVVTAGGATVGIRWPSHPFIQAVIRAGGFPLAAPSANTSNRVSPTNAAHVSADLGERIPLIVDGGQCQVGIESTVFDLTVQPPRVLRPGMVHVESLRAAAPELGWAGDENGAGSGGGILKSPGRLPRHYSPRTRLVVLSWRDDRELAEKIQRENIQVENVNVIAHTVIPSLAEPGRVSVIPRDAEAYARAIYAELHRCDATGAEAIVVEAVPEGAEWRAVADRLRRAAGGGQDLRAN
jgi:L-threonylcarbamoyladenylate synthase